MALSEPRVNVGAIAAMSSWDDKLDEILSQVRSEDEEISMAEACRTQSDDEADMCNLWWVPLLKGHLDAHPQPHSREQPIRVVSSCCGCCSEAECLQAF